VQVGISRVVGPAPCEADVRWAESQAAAREILREGGVVLVPGRESSSPSNGTP
jgi:hypothetical protein